MGYGATMSITQDDMKTTWSAADPVRLSSDEGDGGTDGGSDGSDGDGGPTDGGDGGIDGGADDGAPEEAPQPGV